jgi:iron complex outermembrane recepter protein
MLRSRSNGATLLPAAATSRFSGEVSADQPCQRRSSLRFYRRPSVRRLAVTSAVVFLFAFVALVQSSPAQDSNRDQDAPQSLTKLSLEQLGDVEVTTVSKEPQEVMKTPAAVFVITQEDIRRSGATSIPEALRLAPGVEVAQIDGNHWSVAIRGFAGQF